MPGRASVEVNVAVLASVSESPRHSYEIWATMRERGHDRLLRTSATTVYDAARRLERDGLLVVLDRQRVGRLPERTVYGPTREGTTFLQESVAGLLVESVGDPHRFEVALSFMFALTRRVVRARLTQRIAGLDEQITDGQARLDAARDDGVPAVFLSEHEYHLAILEADRRWVQSLAGFLDQPDVSWPAPAPRRARVGPGAAAPSHPAPRPGGRRVADRKDRHEKGST
jgi:DNA-binding PadR family transcriptional regulator